MGQEYWAGGWRFKLTVLGSTGLKGGGFTRYSVLEQRKPLSNGREEWEIWRARRDLSKTVSAVLVIQRSPHEEIIVSRWKGEAVTGIEPSIEQG